MRLAPPSEPAGGTGSRTNGFSLPGPNRKPDRSVERRGGAALLRYWRSGCSSQAYAEGGVMAPGDGVGHLPVAPPGAPSMGVGRREQGEGFPETPQPSDRRSVGFSWNRQSRGSSSMSAPLGSSARSSLRARDPGAWRNSTSTCSAARLSCARASLRSCAPAARWSTSYRPDDEGPAKGTSSTGWRQSRPPVLADRTVLMRARSRTLPRVACNALRRHNATVQKGAVLPFTSTIPKGTAWS